MPVTQMATPWMVLTLTVITEMVMVFRDSLDIRETLALGFNHLSIIQVC